MSKYDTGDLDQFSTLRKFVDRKENIQNSRSDHHPDINRRDTLG